MKIIVLGSTGMLGHVLCDILNRNIHPIELLKLSKSEKKGYNSNQIDLRDTGKLKKIIQDFNPEVIINCAGILNQQCAIRPHEAIFINSYLPHYLVNEIGVDKMKVIQISTDCVFSGNKGNYSVDSSHDSQTIYGKSKSLGELKGTTNLTIRTSIVGPDTSPRGIGFLNWILQSEGIVEGYTEVFWSGVSTLTLSKIISKCISDQTTGVLQISNPVKISKYNLIENVINVFGLSNKLQLNKNCIQKSDKSMISNYSASDVSIPSYSQMLNEIRNYIENNQNKYQHYELK